MLFNNNFPPIICLSESIPVHLILDLIKSKTRGFVREDTISAALARQCGASFRLVGFQLPLRCTFENSHRRTFGTHAPSVKFVHKTCTAGGICVLGSKLHTQTLWISCEICVTVCHFNGTVFEVSGAVNLSGTRPLEEVNERVRSIAL